MKKLKLSLFKKILFIAVILRLYLQLVLQLTIKLVPFKSSFPYVNSLLSKLGPDWLWRWANFDGVHYLRIVKSGYESGLSQAFFPVYPLLIRWLGQLIHNPLIVGLIISHLAFSVFIYFFIKLARLDYSSKAVIWAGLLLLLFPTSFFYFTVYTESLFLALAAASLYFARTKKYYLASLLAGLASATRLIGIFLLPAILWEYWQANSKKIKAFSVIAQTLLASSGLLSYLYYLKKTFADALIFIHSQPGFGANRQVDKLVMIYQVIFRYLKMLITVSPKNEIFPALLIEFSLSTLALVVIIWAIIKKFRASYLIFIIPVYFLPTLTGTFSSMPRYILACFPLFYLFGQLKNRQLKLTILAISLILLTFSFIRFISGYWIA